MSCVVTLALDDASQLRLQEWRSRFYPPALNRVPAHLSLFHMLPEDAATMAVLQDLAERHADFSMSVEVLRSLGRGVALFVRSDELNALHAELSRAFAPLLTAQDRQGFRPHVVLQNKAGAEAVKLAMEQMQHEFVPFPAQSVGIDVWRYLGGPWELLRRLPFRSSC